MKNNSARFQTVRLTPPASRTCAGSLLPLPAALLGCASDAMAVLRTISAAVIGCGSVGGRIALQLARMGFSGLLLVDPKEYKPSSLATHDIGPKEVGQSKSISVGRRCKAISPKTRVVVFAGPVEALDLAALADMDLVVMAPDLLSVEVEVGQRCLWLDKPLVQASVHGPTLTVQVRLFPNAKEVGGCPVCCYGRQELEFLGREARFSCESVIRATAATPAEAAATNSLSALCSIAADLAVIQILRSVLKLGPPVAGTTLQYNGFTHGTIVSPITRNPKCKLEHSHLAQVLVDEPLARLSLAQLAQRATSAPLTPGTLFELPNMDWVEFSGCLCAKPNPVRQFVPRGSVEQGVCPKCAAALVPLNFYTHPRVSARVLGSAVERPLCKLGARCVRSVLLRNGDAGILIRQQSSTFATL
jgi:molybdopterin/thiamine biosynthesis adenylyltransferase